MRRVTLVEEMFNDVASPSEKLKVNELYHLGNKGSAIVFMLKRIRAQWEVFTGKKGVQEAHESRVIRINEGGTTRLVARN